VGSVWAAWAWGYRPDDVLVVGVWVLGQISLNQLSGILRVEFEEDEYLERKKGKQGKGEG
jgi:hypothetical protein